MSSGSDSVPSWAEAREDALDQLVEKARLRARLREFYGFREQLLETCADVLAQAEGRTMVFLGRSPENLYDLLRALLRGARRAPRLVMFPFSFRVGTAGTATRLARAGGLAIERIARHLDEARLGPAAIANHPSGVLFVDCVAFGTTFGNLDEMLRLVAERRGADPQLMLDNVRYVGLTKASLGWTYWRKDEESQGARFFAEGRASVVPISTRLWCHLAGDTPKTTDSYTPERWAEPPRLSPLDEDRAEAIRLATELRLFGGQRDVRRAFAGMLGRRAHDRPWLGSLIASLLRSTQRKKRSGRRSKAAQSMATTRRIPPKHPP